MNLGDSTAGRYEGSVISLPAGGDAVSIVAGETPIRANNWYYVYARERNYANEKGLLVGSTMIQGAAYDQVMKFVNTDSYNVMEATNVGHSPYPYGDFITTPYQTGGRDYNTNYTGPIPYNDVSKNIFDLEGNVNVWTTEAYNTRYRVRRGGVPTFIDPAILRNWEGEPFPVLYAYSGGLLLQLYIK